jgi:preprotein translocase subunit SecG
VQKFLLWAIIVLLIVLISVMLYQSRSGSHRLNVTPDAKRAIEKAKKRT